MSTVHVEATGIVSGEPEAVYNTLRDYHEGHPAILPKPAFVGLTVEKGGQGAGTEMLVHMNVMGRTQTARHRVSEPEPGRVLVESDMDRDLVTTFTLEPVDGKTRVTISTDFAPKSGLEGLFEKLMGPPMLRRIYKQELRNLDAYMQQQPA